MLIPPPYRYVSQLVNLNIIACAISSHVETHSKQNVSLLPACEDSFLNNLSLAIVHDLHWYHADEPKLKRGNVMLIFHLSFCQTSVFFHRRK